MNDILSCLLFNFTVKQTQIIPDKQVEYKTLNNQKFEWECFKGDPKSNLKLPVLTGENNE